MIARSDSLNAHTKWSPFDFSCGDGVLYGGYEAADPFSGHLDLQGRSLLTTGLTALKAK